MSDPPAALARARSLAGGGDDDAAKQAYLELLRMAPDHVVALVELGALAEASGHLAAARSAFARAVAVAPGNAAAQTGLATMLRRGGELVAAERHYRAALAADPGFAPAHQGLAHTLFARGESGAEAHWRAGFAEHAVIRRRYRGQGVGIPLLLLIAGRGGDVPTEHWIDDRVFAITALCADFYDPALPLPAHQVIVNAIGDADLCGASLASAERLLRGAGTPVINRPSLVAATARAQNARRLGGLPGVVAPRIQTFKRDDAEAVRGFGLPLLLRSPGFHTGQHFVRVAAAEEIERAVRTLPGDELMAIEYLDARGADGMARKYRVMFIDGGLHPLHLAIATDWKVHYFTAAMAQDAGLREEERRFLEDIAGTLGGRAMAALTAIGKTLGLEFCGVDFGLAPDGSVLLFEANATMVINPAGPEPMWDYRRPALDAALAVARAMVARRVG